MAVVAGQIGANLFTVFELEPVSDANVLEMLKRSGVNYHAYKQMGIEFPIQELRCQQEFSSHAIAVLVQQTYNSYIGNNEILIRGATTYGTYKFLKPPDSDYPRVSPPRYSPLLIGSPSGLSAGWIVESVHLVQRQS